MTRKLFFCYCFSVLAGICMLVWVGTRFYNDYESVEQNGVVTEIEQTDITISQDEENHDLDISLMIPYEMQPGMALAFYTSHQNIRVTIGDREVYHLIAGNNDFGKTPGVTWNIVPLDTVDAGSEIRIQQSTPYRFLEKNIPVIYLGSIPDIYQKILVENILPLFLCVIITALGIFFVAYWLFIRKRGGMDGQLLYLGCFAIMLGLWSANETPIIPLLTRGKIVPAYWSFLTLMFMMIPFTMFIKSLYREKNHPAWFAVCLMSFANILICIGLCVFRIADFRETLLLTHITMVVFAVVALIMTVREIRSGKVTKEMKINIICIFIDVAGLVLDLVFYYMRSGDSNIFGRICFLIYVAVLGMISSRNSIELMQRGREAAIYEHLAFNDQLTGIQNRTAYARDLVDWRNKDLTNVGIIMLDLNDLKKCNDTYGHAEGDRYIMAAVDVLSKCFHDTGNFYRIGGDEFCVIMPNMTNQREEDVVAELASLILEYNQTEERKINMSIAWGCACFNPATDRTLEDTIARADEEMYRRKIEMKGGQNR